MKIPFSYSFRNLWTRRLTTILTMGGIGLVVFVFSAILMLTNGLEKTLIATGQEDNVVVVRKSAQTEMMSAVSRESASIVKSLPEVTVGNDGKPVASSELNVIINIFKKGTSDVGNVTVRGVMANEAMALRPQVQLVEGKMFRQGSSEIVVGMSIHKRFEGCNIGDQIRFGGQQWTIVGIIDGQQTAFDSEIWGDVEQMLPAFGRPVYSAMTMRLKDPSDFKALKVKFETDPRLQQLEVRREKEFFAAQSEMMAMFLNVLGLAITIIFSFGAMIGAMITMYAAVSNRTIEIGTLRALGFKRRNVLAAFLMEAIVISLLGGGFGLLIASGLQFFTVSTTNWGSFSELAFSFALSPGIAMNSLIFAIIMGVVGGFLPAVRASRLKIVNALRAA